MASYSPHLIDAGSTDNLGSYSMAPNGYGWAEQNSPFVVGTALYFVAYRTSEAPGTDFTINIFKSTDLGNTWTLLDGAGAPNRGNQQATGACIYDGADTITVAWTTGNGQGTTGAIQLQDFQISTSTWGAPYGAAGSPVVGLVNQIYKRPDGSLIALFNRTFASGRVEGLSAAVFAAGAWGAPFAVDTNLTADRISDSRSATVLDSIGTLHIFMRCLDSGTLLFKAWSYQQVHSDNSLGAFHNFAVGDAATSVFMNGEGNPVIVGNQIVFGVMNSALSNSILFVGTPLNNPVWSIGTGMDPAPPFSAGDTYYVPVLARSSTKLYALVRITDTSVNPPDLSLRLLQTTNLANPIAGPWTAQTIYDMQVDGPPSFNFNGQIWNNATLSVYEATPGADQVFVTAGATIDVTANQDTWFWFGLFSLPAPQLFAAGGGAGGRFRCCPPQSTIRNRMLEELARHIKNRRDAWPYEHEFPDRMGKNQEPLASIAAPAVGVKTPVLVYQVPYGFFFYLEGLVQDFEGSSFNPGDASWTVDQDAQFSNVQGAGVQGLVNLPVPLGSFAVGRWWKLPRTYKFSQLTVLRSVVTNANIVPGAPNVFTSQFLGYLEPVVR